MSYKELHRFVEMLSNSTDYNINLHFTPNVGESTLHKDFVKIWNETAELKNVRLSLTSNGVLLQKHLNEMNLEPLKNMIISVDGGNEEAHAAMRGQNTFDRTLKTLREIDSRKLEDKDFYLQINTVITRLNIGSLSQLPALLENFETENIILNLLRLSTDRGNARKNKHILEVSLEEIRNHLGDIISTLNLVNEKRKERKKSEIKLRLELFTSKEQLLLLKSYSNKLHYSDILFEFSPGWGKSCGAYNLKRIFVDPYGYLFPCFNFADPSMRQEFLKYAGPITPPNFVDEEYEDLGAILSHTFFQNAQGWLGEIYGKLYCNSCPLKSSCTVCPAYAYFWGVPNVCKEI